MRLSKLLGVLALAMTLAMAATGHARGEVQAGQAESAMAVAVPDDPALVPGAWWETDIWSRVDRGFTWYPPDDPPVRRKKAPPVAPIVPLSAFDSTKAINKHYEALKDIAVINPTERNVYAFHKFKAEMLDQSQRFTAVSQRVVWQSPDIDFNNINPFVSFAQTDIRNASYQGERDQVAAIAQEYGLLFFYRSDCSYCHIQAPVLADLAQRFGIQVIPVSLDGGPIPGFANWRPDNGIARRVSAGRGIEVTPTLYLVSRRTQEAIMLGSGVMGQDDIVRRILVFKTRSVDQQFDPRLSVGRPSTQR